ncbi:MAG TPA: FAD/NAD(P)-binding protein [Streptosporangiaceae bacterium]|nr:FAD/NAD(P)-binding protein [Streptosporangiaceae bacterium]
MGRADHLPGDGPTVAIIGGGASGTLAAVQLLRRAGAAALPLRVVLIDRDGRHGLGRAYSTTHPCHLLNSPAGRMSALPGDPGHLARWAQAEGIQHDGFLARRDYGRYLAGLLADAQRRAWPTARLSCVTAEVVSAGRPGPGRPLRLGLAGGGGPLEADIAVLATGSLPPGAPCPVPAGPRYVADPWAPGALDGTGDGRPVIIIGTGLTMLDLAMTVTDANPATVVHAVSRHALLPREHRGAPVPGHPPVPAIPALAGGPLRLAGLVRQVRSAAARHPGDWQDVIDVLRPQVPALWQRLPTADQRLFLRRYARYWEVHRHRVPPATAGRIARLRAAGRLQVRPGQIVAATGGPDGVRVSVAHGGTVTDLDGSWLINGTGPAADITAAAGPLLGGLLASGLARPDPLRLGLDADAFGAVIDAAGGAGDRIFALGPPLRGTRYETTAITEIAGQAESLARHLITVSPVLARRGSAA